MGRYRGCWGKSGGGLWSARPTMSARILGGRAGASAPTGGTRSAVKRAVGDAGPYGCIIDGAVGRGDVGIVPYGGFFVWMAG